MLRLPVCTGAPPISTHTCKSLTFVKQSYRFANAATGLPVEIIFFVFSITAMELFDILISSPYHAGVCIGSSSYTHYTRAHVPCRPWLFLHLSSCLSEHATRFSFFVWTQTPAGIILPDDSDEDSGVHIRKMMLEPLNPTHHMYLVHAWSILCAFSTRQSGRSQFPISPSGGKAAGSNNGVRMSATTPSFPLSDSPK